MYCSDGKYRMRIYDDGKLSTYEDYEIAISDLFFVINDEDAHLYEDSAGIKWIDHNPQTLGRNME